MEHLLATRAPATASNRYRALKRFFGFLLEEGEITSSPMENMKPPKVPEIPPAVLTDDQLRALLKACSGKAFDDKRDTALLRCFIDTGARRAEILGLRWSDDPDDSDVDLDQGQLYVLGKGRRYRTLPIGAKTIRALDTYIRARRAHAYATATELWVGLRGPLGLTAIRDILNAVHARRGSTFTCTSTCSVTPSRTTGSPMAVTNRTSCGSLVGSLGRCWTATARRLLQSVHVTRTRGSVRVTNYEPPQADHVSSAQGPHDRAHRRDRRRVVRGGADRRSDPH